ncbi:hypothetical protein [Nocardioides sp. zg-DK7169]|uniref:hypothetical protein n=1 Tax=Nocardioides sp. zg-DK7169 TaxID=2736600 RepID=UPI001555ECFB|nr:hypothetical protein [Nocardioides sp. zg-DK7169]NPC95262.1 hypothetical protein [Nocardioides sp. zg-DK7169]
MTRPSLHHVPRPRPGTRRRTRLRVAVGVALLPALLSACGSGTSAGSPADDPAARSSDLLITSDALPAGWGDSNSQGLDYRLTVCGVDLEPETPARASSLRFSEGPFGPFLEQHVRVYRTDVIADVIADLRTALPGCSGYTARGTRPDSPTARFTVEPLTVKGAPPDSVAWRQTSRGRLPVTADVVVVRSGDAAVTLMSYALRDTPDPAVLARAVAALPEVG